VFSRWTDEWRLLLTSVASRVGLGFAEAFFETSPQLLQEKGHDLGVRNRRLHNVIHSVFNLRKWQSCLLGQAALRNVMLRANRGFPEDFGHRSNQRELHHTKAEGRQLVGRFQAES